MKSLLLSILLCSSVFAMDVPFGYRSIGIDTYADGSVVNDGECYALVCSQREFYGFLKNGKLADTNDVVILIRPIAKDGRCPPVNFMIPEDFYSTHKEWNYYVVIIDTRGADGKSYGIDSNGQLMRANAWQFANVEKDISSSTIATSIDSICNIPADMKKPNIVSFEADHHGNFIVKFTNAEQYATYGLEYGTSLQHIDECRAASIVDGKANSLNTLVLTKKEADQFNSLLLRVISIDVLTK